MVNLKAFQDLKSELSEKQVSLVAVSKTKTVADIQELYDAGQRDFGENYVQELVDKHEVLPKDIRWHFIGHLQSNKVKYIAPFVDLIHGVDSLKLLQEINKQAYKNHSTIECLLQVHISTEETKFGFDEAELTTALAEIKGGGYNNVSVSGLMGMASFSEDKELVRSEFRKLKSLYDQLKDQPGGEIFSILSMGMSADYTIAIEEGSNMVRIGSLLFGVRL